jgi:hypothetical protein
MKVAVSLVLFLVAAFCVFGFIAAGEPGANNIPFRIGYPLVGLLCLAIAVALQLRKK